jgi:hypothetical protein
MTAETHDAEANPEGPETTESLDEPEMPDELAEESEEAEVKVEDTDEASETTESEESEKMKEPDISEFAEASGYVAGDLVPAYDEIPEQAYDLDKDSEKVFIGDSTWEEVEGILSEKSSDFLTGKIKDQLYNNRKEYTFGGAAGIGTGLFTGVLGYTTAAGLMITGGSAILGLGVGGYLSGKIEEYLSDDRPREIEETEDSEIEHELDEYSEWEVEIVNEGEYRQAVNEYMEKVQ